ncbi:MAG TPA: Fe-Mn family superoxide dismutase [Candidatus Paceibacterota bacterium]|nr:Fe-Mn family superoxide dismutase [Candidatus Paceibacterota bacterium]
MEYVARPFTIPQLDGLSQKQMEVHLGLYEGYVKHVNLIRSQIKELKDSETNAYVISELRRRFAFEFDGMRMHEYYFEQFEGGAQAYPKDGALASAITDKYGDWSAFISHVKEVAGTRGIGWVVVYYDPAGRTLHTVFVGDHELGQLAGLPIVLAVDLWEHAYMVDYVPAEKMSYVDAFLQNVNWNVVEKRMLEEIA